MKALIFDLDWMLFFSLKCHFLSHLYFFSERIKSREWHFKWDGLNESLIMKIDNRNSSNTKISNNYNLREKAFSLEISHNQVC